jgi:hypothetical protein
MVAYISFPKSGCHWALVTKTAILDEICGWGNIYEARLMSMSPFSDRVILVTVVDLRGTGKEND